MLAYKCEWSGVAFEKADRWFASTKTCSDCGEKKIAMAEESAAEVAEYERGERPLLNRM